ncbi:hypothetical protein [Pseudomonas sp. NPDC087615]|uniref:hypothetical protein n=1 Tax=Pseudomonas sp. NPDC087615 TaxID=3364443 RepID=UPI0037F3B2B3
MSMLDFIGELGRVEKIHRKPHIPRDKAYNAIASYCPTTSYDDIQILIDETVFGNAKVGVIITENEICGKDNFCDPFHYSLPKVSSLFVKKGLMNSTLYINEQQVIKLTQASGAKLVYLFERIEKYLLKNKNIPTPKPSATPVASSISEAPLTSAQPYTVQPINPPTTQIQAQTSLPASAEPFLEPALEMVETVVVEPAEEDASVEEPKTKSRFRRWPKDDLINSIQANKHVSAVFNFIGDVLSDNKSTKSAALRREVQVFLTNSVLRLRKEYIDRNHVIGLMNDVATMELMIYSIAYLRLELADRQIDPRMITYTMSEGVKAFLSLDNSTSSRNMLANLLHLADAMGENIDAINFTFYMRILMSNMKGGLADDEFDMSQLRTLASFHKNQPPREALVEIVEEFAVASMGEFGDISSNRQMSNDARRCADSVIDLF